MRTEVYTYSSHIAARWQQTRVGTSSQQQHQPRGNAPKKTCIYNRNQETAEQKRKVEPFGPSSDRKSENKMMACQ